MTQKKVSMFVPPTSDKLTPQTKLGLDNPIKIFEAAQKPISDTWNDSFFD